MKRTIAVWYGLTALSFILILAACGSGGGSSMAGSRLFVADGANRAVGSMITKR